MTAQEKLIRRLQQSLHICVGLDADIDKIPLHLKSNTDPLLEFNKAVIEQTYEHTAAYKINFAFYEKYGQKGFKVLHKTIEFIPKDILIIADAKRGDIGNTSQMYAEAIFDYLHCDATTLHPYMGYDSLKPFFDYSNKYNFVLALTSNIGAEDFEKTELSDGRLLFQKVIQKVHEWNRYDNCGIVFGATKIDELKKNIPLFGHLPVLLPGVGAQGGSLEDVVDVFESHRNSNYIINISRALIYCDSSKTFGKKINKSIKELNNSVFQIISQKKDSN